MKRRNLLRSSAALGASLPFWPSFQRQAAAQASASNKKLIFIFQRGGNDGINTIIPRGDSAYNTDLRPNIFISDADAIDSGNGFADFHPGLEPMMEIYNSTALNGIAGMGNLAAIHRVGYARQSRSHFDSQDYWERGAIRNSSIENGMFYRHLEASGSFATGGSGLVAAGLSSNGLTSLRGDIPVPNFNRSSDFDFRGNDTERAAFSSAIRQMYSGTGLGGRTPSALVHATGTSLSNTLTTLASARGDYAPANGALYPDSDLGRKLQEAALLIKRTGISIIGVNRGGHDTHINQGGSTGSQQRNLYDLAMGFNALSKDLQDQWDDVLVVTMTEFGRTSKQNGSNGTDHAEASTMFVAGGAVNGGIYNCAAETWEENALISSNARYLEMKTDFRAIFWEIFAKHFGDDAALREQIIPGYALANLADSASMTELGIL